MPKVDAWLLEETDTPYRTEAEYRRGRASYLRGIRQERDRQRRIAGLDAWIASARNSLTSFEQIEEWLVSGEFPGPILDSPQLSSYGLRKPPKKHKDHDRQLPIFRSFRFRGLKWSEWQSNTHCAPTGKPTNWGGDPDYPRGYPGWCGHIKFYTNWLYDRRFSDLLKILGIRTGGGGTGDGIEWSYDFTMFDEEWAGMAVMRELMKDDA